MEAAIFAMLSHLMGGRVYWVRAPQGAVYPLAVLQLISTARDYTMQGQTRFVASRVQIDVYAERYLDLVEEAGAVVRTLSGRRSETLQIMIDVGDRDMPADSTGEASRLYRRQIDIIVHHRES